MRVRAMLHLVKPGRAYDPETVVVMTAAFDSIYRSVPAPGVEDMRRALASTVLRNVDQGERDPRGSPSWLTANSPATRR
jgi:hypothetical protein